MTPEQKAILENILANNGCIGAVTEDECKRCPVNIDKKCRSKFIAARSLLESGKEKRKEKWVPKVGERVGFESDTIRNKGQTAWRVGPAHEGQGLIVGTDDYGLIFLVSESDGFEHRCTRRQLRRLRTKKKERKTFQVRRCYNSNHDFVCFNSETKLQPHCGHCEVLTVREVKAAKGGEHGKG